MEIKDLLLKCKELGVTRKAIAERSYTTPRMIGHYMTGYKVPSKKSEMKIRFGIKKLGMDLIDLGNEHSKT